MNQKITSEIKEEDHGIAGLGLLKIDYIYGNGHHDYTITSELMRCEINYQGDKAKQYANDLLENEHKSLINVKRMACESCKITMAVMMSKTRLSEAVFARNLVMYYAVKYLGFSFAAAAKTVGKDHSTAIFAINKLKDGEKYMKQQHIDWFRNFKKLARI